jgi:HSP20 family molecular chaperone IbpA
MNEGTKRYFSELSNLTNGSDIPAPLPEPTTPNEPEAMLVKTKTPAKDQYVPSEDEVLGDGEGQLTIDVYQTQDKIIIESPIAGVSPDDLDVSITNESVTIKGKRERSSRVRDDDYFYQECYWGRFSRAVILPHEVDAESATATIKNGVLIITLPKITKAKSRKIKVQFH